jgi:hypothetical protein
MIGGVIQQWDDEQRRSERSEALAAIAARDGSAERIEAARLAREVAASQVAAGSETFTSATNFLPPEQRETWTVPAGESLYSIPDPRPDARTDVHGERLANADLARAIGQEITPSGSTEVRRSDEVAQWLINDRGLRQVMVRDRLGRLSIDWRALSGVDE